MAFVRPCNAVVMPPSAPPRACAAGVRELQRAAMRGESCWPAAAATDGADVADSGRRSGLTGLLRVGLSIPGASGSGQGSVYDNNRTASVVMDCGNAEQTMGSQYQKQFTSKERAQQT